MAYVKTITKVEKIEKGEVRIKRLLSDYEVFFDEEGNIRTGFKSAKDLYAVVIPTFCKQLQMKTKVCHYDNYTSMISDARIFCNRVYESTSAYGVEIQGSTIDAVFNAIKLITKDGEFLYTLDKGVPQLLNPKICDYKFIRRLTLNKESKMSKKLWSVTDWLLYR